LEWAKQIVPQERFLSLPVEIRKDVYSLVLAGSTVSSPRKDRLKFKEYRLDDTTSRSSAIKRYNTLSVLSRQTHVDVVGSGLLYHCAKFTSTTPNALAGNVKVINPAHKNTLRDLTINVGLVRYQTPFPKLLLPILASLTTLTNLRLIFWG